MNVNPATPSGEGLPHGARMADLVEEFWDLDAVEGIFRRGVRVSPDDFRDAFHQRLQRRGRLLLTGSARQALLIVLSSLAAGSPRRRVLLSSFNCRVVKEAADKAGLAIDTFDFAASNGRIDWGAVGERLTAEHLAIVVPHFFGIPADFNPLVPLARRKGVMIVEDCAHALGASIGGIPAGLLGDAAVFSFNYDKPISLAGGGGLLLNHASIDIDGAAVEVPLAPRAELHQFRQMAAMLRYNRTPRERRPLVARIGGKLRVPPYAVPRAATGFGALRAAVGVWQLERFDEIKALRNEHARILKDSLGHLCWHVAQSVEPAHLKLRVILSPGDREYVTQRCRERRITLANSNWPHLIEPEAAPDARINAYRAATFGLEVPVHQNLSRAQLSAISGAFANAKRPDW